MKIRARGTCPMCGGKFKEIDWTFICKKCYTRPSRYYIEFSWKKKQRKIYSTSTGKALIGYAQTKIEMEKIRQRIQSGEFSLAEYKKGIISQVLFDTFANWRVARYKQMLECGKISPSTYNQLQRYTRLDYLPFFSGRDLRGITTQDIENFQIKLLSRLSPVSTQTILKYLHKLFTDAKKYKKIKIIPEFPSMSPQYDPPIWITKEMFSRIFEYIREEHWPLFLCLYFMGLRPAEARALFCKDVDWACQTMIIRRTYSDNILVEFTKTKKIRILPIHPRLYEAILPRRDQKGFLFVDDAGRSYSHHAKINRIWKQALQDAGYPHCKPYCLRHGFASNALSRGIPAEIIMRFLGHTNLSTTNIYLHTNINSLRQCFDLD